MSLNAAKTFREISFDCSDEDQDLIHQIVRRADKLGLINRNYSAMTCSMDVTALHCNGYALRLRDLRDADDFNFMHDIVGIARHINRDTARLENGFRPRFSARPTPSLILSATDAIYRAWLPIIGEAQAREQAEAFARRFQISIPDRSAAA